MTRPDTFDRRLAAQRRGRRDAQRRKEQDVTRPTSLSVYSCPICREGPIPWDQSCDGAHRMCNGCGSKWLEQGRCLDCQRAVDDVAHRAKQPEEGAEGVKGAIGPRHMCAGPRHCVWPVVPGSRFCGPHGGNAALYPEVRCAHGWLNCRCGNAASRKVEK